MPRAKTYKNLKQPAGLFVVANIKERTAQSVNGEVRSTPIPWVPGARVKWLGKLVLVASTDRDGDGVYYLVNNDGHLELQSYIEARSIVAPATDAEIDTWCHDAGLVD